METLLVFVFVIKLTLSHPGPRGASTLKGFRGWRDLSFRFVIESLNVLTTTAKVVFGLLCEAGNTTWTWLILSCTPLPPSSTKGDGKYHESYAIYDRYGFMSVETSSFVAVKTKPPRLHINPVQPAA